MRSGAPPSSTLRCAVSAQTTPSHGWHIARSAMTFAPVPLKTKKRLGVVAELAAEQRRRRAAVHSSWP